MGRVFTYEAIEAGEVPGREVFDDARRIFLTETEAGVGAGYFAGGFIYGSVAGGIPNRRSDIDTFIALNAGTPANYSAAQFVTGRIALECGIPVVPIVHTRQDLESSRHDIDRFFGQHLTGRGRIRVPGGEDPAEFMTFREDDAETILSGYLAQKKRRLVNTYMSVDPLNVEEGGLQRLLELPAAVGRKTLQALADIEHIDEAVELSANTAAVTSKTQSVLAEEDRHLAGAYEALVEQDSQYHRMVDDVLNGKVDKETYEAYLRNLHCVLPQAIKWLARLEETILPILARA